MIPTWLMYVGIGLGVIVLLIVALFVFGIMKVRSSETFQRFTTSNPDPVKTIDDADATYRNISDDLDHFANRVQSGKEASIELSEQEINVLLQKFQDFWLWRGIARIEIEGQGLSGSIRLPLGQYLSFPINLFVRGRYLAGEATFRIDTEGYAGLYVQDLSVKRTSLPEDFMNYLRRENLLIHATDRNEQKQLLRRVKTVEIRNQKLFVEIDSAN